MRLVLSLFTYFVSITLINFIAQDSNYSGTRFGLLHGCPCNTIAYIYVYVWYTPSNIYVWYTPYITHCRTPRGDHSECVRQLRIRGLSLSIELEGVFFVRTTPT